MCQCRCFNSEDAKFLNICIFYTYLILNSSPMLMTEKLILFDLFVGQYPINDYVDPNTDKNEHVNNIQLSNCPQTT